MPLTNKSFDDLGESDIVELLTNAVPEGLLIEYKRQVYEGSNDAKKEYLKDVSAFANASGGHLIIGVAEEGGVPTEIVPFVGDADAEVRRLDSLAQDGIQPRLSGLRIKAVALAGGGHCLVAYVPRSFNPPHRVIVAGANRFHVRRSTSVTEPDVEELRVLFGASATWRDRVAAFRAQRVALIDAQDTPSPLARQGGLLAVHLVPLGAFSGQSVDVDVARSNSHLFAPIGTGAQRPRLNFDGFINIDAPDVAYTQVFRSGILELATTGLTHTQNSATWLPIHYVEQQLIAALPRLIQGLAMLAVTTPLAVAITVMGVRGAVGTLGNNISAFVQTRHTIPQHQLELPVVMVDEAPQTANGWHKALRPAFDALANASGLSRADWFDQDGNWIER